jgi:hypothetical protein
MPERPLVIAFRQVGPENRSVRTVRAPRALAVGTEQLPPLHHGLGGHASRRLHACPA